MSNHPRTDLKQQRINEGQARLEYWNGLSIIDKIKSLKLRPGHSKRQLKKLSGVKDDIPAISKNWDTAIRKLKHKIV